MEPSWVPHRTGLPNDPIAANTAPDTSQASHTLPAPVQQDMHALHLEHQSHALQLEVLQSQLVALQARIERLEQDKKAAMQALIPHHPAWHVICSPFSYIVQRIEALETLACSNLNALQAFASRPDPFAPARTISVD